MAEEANTLLLDEAAMREFIITDNCHRLGLSQYLNGESEGMSCTGLEAEMCDNCWTCMTDSIMRKRRLEVDQAAI